ncbi:MAG: TrbC/VIRB2 family protein [Rhodoferax sp.]|nr:TrbC/VIRB2 family protein [Rhodoferax sp.]MBP6492619.1 TrbC/VIRB2 family protein [Rhodoferax sp.]MBP7574518.1 TrbC/VIRB2 family protein [Rhodoferax sp.]
MNLINRYRQIKFALATNHAACEQTNSRALVLIAGLAVASLLLTPGLAMATPWDGAAASVLAIFTGGLARTIAIIAVIACGIAAIAGKLSWDWAIKIIVGIVLIFGATSIVDYVIAAV